MARLKVTGWHIGSINPVHVGWYERKYRDGSNNRTYWNGLWLVHENGSPSVWQSLRWRGLADQPDVEPHEFEELKKVIALGEHSTEIRKLVDALILSQASSIGRSQFIETMILKMMYSNKRLSTELDRMAEDQRIKEVEFNKIHNEYLQIGMERLKCLTQ